MDLKLLFGIRGLPGWILAGLFGIVLSSAFVMVYNFSGTHIVNPSGATDYKWMPGQYKGNAAEGINFMHMDANGFNNLSSDTKEIALLLMGGSHMEAVQIKTEDNTGSLLNSLMPDKKTYNIGMPGHQLLNCLDNLEAALDEYSPSEYVVIQTGSLDVSADSMKELMDGTFADIPSYDSGLIYHLQKIPALKVIYKQLLDKISAERYSTAEETEEDVQKTDKQDENTLQVLKTLLMQKERICNERGVRLFIAYTPPVYISEDGGIMRGDDQKWIENVENCCSEANIMWADCFDAFAKQYEKYYEIPFGFHNTTIGSGHLNAAGHRVLAEEIIKMIQEGEK